MIEHPGWTRTDEGRRRVVRTATGTWLARTGAEHGITLACIEGSEDDKPTVVATAPDQLPQGAPAELLRALAKLATVERLANPSLWDALTTAILRQVVRADQARKLYRAWCATYGVPAGAIGAATVPQAAKVADMPDAQFAAVGAKFHRAKLLAAAAAYLSDGARWTQLPAEQLVQALTQVPGIGPWTARAAAADFTGDFSVYPHADLAVRTWARKAAPGCTWHDGERAFEATWRSYAATAAQLSALTLFTLTWGSNDRPDHLPDTP